MIKLLFGLIGGLFFATMAWSYTYAAEAFYYTNPPQPGGSTTEQGSIKDQVKVAATDTQGPIQRLIKVFLPNRPAGEGVVGYIQYVANIALSLVAFIAVIVLIYGFYGILFGSSEEGIKNAQKTVKGTIIAILLMGAAWIIVRLMFYIIAQLK